MAGPSFLYISKVSIFLFVTFSLEQHNNMLKTIDILFIFILVTIAGLVLKKPQYNWDMLPYMAIVISLDEDNTTTIHQKTYDAARENIPPDKYAALIDSNNAYRKMMSQNSQKFFDELLLYHSKPLYVFFVFILSLFFALPMASVIPSILGYVVCGWVFYIWINRYVDSRIALLISLFWIVSWPVLDTAGLSTPDFLCSAFILAGFFCWVEKRNLMISITLFGLAVMTRLDVGLLLLIFVAWLYYDKEIQVRSVGLIGIFLMVMCWTLIWASHYDVIKHFKVQFMDPFSAKQNMGFVNYLSGVWSGIKASRYSHFSIFILFFLMPITYHVTHKIVIVWNRLNICVMILALHTVARFFLAPMIEDRLMIPHYALFVLFAFSFSRKLDNSTEPIS